MKSPACFILFLLTALSSFANPAKPRILALIAEREYETKTTLPAFFESELKKDYDISIIHLEDGKHDFVGLEEELKKTDLLIVSVRRRTPTESQLAALRKYIASGKPVLGIRTASHAFAINKSQKNIPAGHAAWQSWDGDIFGGSYSGHLGAQQATTAKVVLEHAITKGLPSESFATGGSLYTVKPLSKGSQILLTGSAEGGKEDQPVSWSFQRKDGGHSFYTSLGHLKDFQSPHLPLLLKQATQWLLANSRKAKK
ncbi:MAG: ThuA domain-containing protein [Akkermansiaceae bacterium]|jgi:type 1 glutamine amidotransferase